jgi:hypothetical protein
VAVETGDGWLTLPISEFEHLNAQVRALANNAERAINILTPMFVSAQEADSPDEEALGNALDVLAGYFGQNGRPLRRLEELEDLLALERLKSEQLVALCRERTEQRDGYHALANTVNEKVKLLEGELAHARALPEQLRTAIKWNEEQRDIQAREIVRLRQVSADHWVEIERLKADLAVAASDTALGIIEQRDREIERLRGQLRPSHTPTCACLLCLDAYGPVEQRNA